MNFFKKKFRKLTNLIQFYIFIFDYAILYAVDYLSKKEQIRSKII